MAVLSPPALPATDGPASFFWTSGASGELRVLRCGECRRYLHPSSAACPGCPRAELDQVVVDGTGHVVAWTRNAHAWPGGPDGAVTIVVVELPDAPGVRITSALIGSEEARMGMAVKVVFEEVEDVWLPLVEASGEPDRVAPVAAPTRARPLRPPADRFEQRVAITGAGASEVGRRLRRSELSLVLDACSAALDDAGLTVGDIDGLSAHPGPDGAPGVGSGGVRSVEQALEVHPVWHSAGAETPGQLGAVINAMLAVAAGLCQHVLCWTSVRRAALPWAVDPHRRLTGEAQWRVPFGAVSPAHWIALYASHYLDRFDADRDALGWLAVSSRRHAASNPAALHRDGISIEDHRRARMVTTPFGLLDCDVPCDGAWAVVVSSRRSAGGLRHRPVLVEATGTRISERQSWDQGTLSHQPNLFGVADHLWSRSALKPQDVDLALLYDGFTFNALCWLEALGFCGIGEAPGFVQGAQRIGPGGPLPLNPHGGQLAAGRSNGFGGLVEGVTQLRGLAGDRQVHGAEVAVVSSGGGVPACCLLLTRSE